MARNPLNTSLKPEQVIFRRLLDLEDRTYPVSIKASGAGPAGAEGPMGPEGPKGEKGAAGTNGTNGTNGAEGPQGPAGAGAPIAARLATAAALPAYTRSTNVLTANANATLAAIDGVTPAVNNYILLKDGAAGADNGPYKVTSVGSAGSKWTMERVVEFDTSPEAIPGSMISIAEGTANQDTVWQLITNSSITLNTTALVFAPVTHFTELKKQTAGEVVLTEAYQDLTGATFTTPFAGNWTVRGYFDWQSNTNAFLIGILLVGGVQVDTAEAHWNVSGRLVTAMEWKTGFVAAGTVIKLQAKRAGGTASPTYSGHTRLIADRTS